VTIRDSIRLAENTDVSKGKIRLLKRENPHDQQVNPYEKLTDIQNEAEKQFFRSADKRTTANPRDRAWEKPLTLHPPSPYSDQTFDSDFSFSDEIPNSEMLSGSEDVGTLDASSDSLDNYKLLDAEARSLPKAFMPHHVPFSSGWVDPMARGHVDPHPHLGPRAPQPRARRNPSPFRCQRCNLLFLAPAGEGGSACPSCRPSARLDDRSFRHGFRLGLQSARAALAADRAAPPPPPPPRSRDRSALAPEPAAPPRHSGGRDHSGAALRALLADSERRILAAVDGRVAAAERDAATRVEALRAEALRATLRGVRDGSGELRSALDSLAESLRRDLPDPPPPAPAVPTRIAGPHGDGVRGWSARRPPAAAGAAPPPRIVHC
jgi:hypothetical protein